MTWRLDPPIRLGPRLFAAVTESDISAHPAGPLVVARAGKWPRTILMLFEGNITALDIEGRVHSPADTARTYPEAVAQFRAMQSDAPNASDPSQ